MGYNNSVKLDVILRLSFQFKAWIYNLIKKKNIESIFYLQAFAWHSCTLLHLTIQSHRCAKVVWIEKERREIGKRAHIGSLAHTSLVLLQWSLLIFRLPVTVPVRVFIALVTGETTCLRLFFINIIYIRCPGITEISFFLRKKYRGWCHHLSQFFNF